MRVAFLGMGCIGAIASQANVAGPALTSGLEIERAVIAFLVRAGHQIVLCRDPAALSAAPSPVDLAPAGTAPADTSNAGVTPAGIAPPRIMPARMVLTVAEAVAEAEIVVSLVADDLALHHLTMRAGLLDAMEPGAVHVSMTPASVPEMRHLMEMHAAKHQQLMSAPVFAVSGTVALGQLWVAAAGEAETLRRVRPLLEAVDQGLVVVGSAPWHANLMHSATDTMSVGMREAFSEVCATMRDAGIPIELFLPAAATPLQPGLDGPPDERRHDARRAITQADARQAKASEPKARAGGQAPGRPAVHPRVPEFGNPPRESPA